MKKHLKMRFAILIIWGVYMSLLVPQTRAQNQQYKPRLSIEYHKIMGVSEFLLVNGKFKGENGYEPIINLTLNVYQQVNSDSTALAGQIITDNNGNAQFDLVANVVELNDSFVDHKYIIKIEDNLMFRNATKEISYIESDLMAEAVVQDSLNYISARFLDILGNPVEGEKVSVLVDRLFAPLTIGKAYHKTDKEGTILVPMEKPLPGIDGRLTFEIKVDSKKYGNVSRIFDASIGEVIVDRSTFDQRTMWSPPGKTPIFLWVLANALILGVWATVLLLFINLYKIYNSKI